MRDRRLIVIGLLFVALLAFWQVMPALNGEQLPPAPVVGDVPASQAKEYTFDVGADVSLEFAEVAGSIVIYPGAPGSVKAIVTRRSFGTDKDSARREIDSFDVVPRQREHSISFSLGVAARPRRQVDYKITTPPDASVKISSGSGSVTVGGIRGSVYVNGQTVSVIVSDVRGPISISVQSGDLRISDSIGETNIQSQTSPVQIDRLTAQALSITTGANVVVKDSGTESDATFQVKNGDLTLTRFRAQTLTAEVLKGQLRVGESEAQRMDVKTQAGLMNLFRTNVKDLRATTTTGEVVIDQTQGGLDIKTQSGTVTLTEVGAAALNIAAGAGNVTFYGALPADGEHTIRTSSGNIDIFVVKESAFRLDASTKGTITIDPPFVLESAELNPGRWRGVIHQGSMLLVLNSTSGDISISSDRPF